MSDNDLAAALLDALDDGALATLAERLRPHLATSGDDPPLLNARQAAARLGLHEKTVVRMAREGRLLGAVRVGRGWRFDPAGLVPQRRTSMEPAPTSRRRRRPMPGDRSSVRAIRGEPLPSRREDP